MGVVVVTDSQELLGAAIETLSSTDIDLRVLPDGLSPQQAAARSAGADVLLIGILPFPRAALAQLDGTGLLIRCGIGVDIIDVDYATGCGIWVANVPEYCVDEVADHTLLLLLAAARQARHFTRAWAVEGRWAGQQLIRVPRLAGQTLGVVGLGRIGTQVAARARAFGMRVLACDPRADPGHFGRAGVERVDFEQLLASSDVVSLHAPHTPETHHLLGADSLARVRPGCIVVNTSRGGLIDLDALDEALERGTVAAAGLDVVEGEPAPDPTHPLFARPNVFVTPHVAWYSSEARRELGRLAAENATRYVRGERPLNLVNPSARERPGIAAP